MSSSLASLSVPLADEDSPLGLTPVVPTFTGLVSQAVAPELLEALERYKLVARLGHGGMAEVFLAAWEVAPFVHRPVVIKRLHEHFSQDPNLVQMFTDEARLLCLLDHPHIVRTLEAGVIEGRCCIAMEYLEGQPLHRVLRRAYQRGKLSPEHAVSMAIAMLDALDYAHDAKNSSGQPLEIVHRDVSPHNVFLTNDGQIKVLDFGIAKAKTQEGLTATGIVKGKVGYIAPEQAAGDAVDRRADVWSAGVLLWEALTGVRLFKGETDAATLNLTLTGEIWPATTRRAELPVELDIVLAGALQRKPLLRYPSAGAMQRDLENWLASVGQQRDPAALAGLMRELFPSEIVEQRRLVAALMARSDCTPPSPISTRTPNSTSALILSTPSPTSADLSKVSDQVAALSHRHKRAYRSLFALLALFAGFALGVAYFVVLKLNPKVAATAPVAAVQLPVVAARERVEPPPEVTPLAPVVAESETRTLDSAGTNPHRASLMATSKGPISSGFHLPRVALARAALVSGMAGSNGEPGTINTASRSDAPQNFGFLSIDTSPWSFVSIGGKLLGQTPLVGLRLPSGTQTLSLRNPELGIETSYSVTIEAGKTSARRIGIE